MQRIRLIKKQITLDWEAIAEAIPKAPVAIQDKLYQTILAARELRKVARGFIDPEQKWSKDATMLCSLTSEVLTRETGRTYPPNLIRRKMTRAHLTKWEVVINTLEFKATPSSMAHTARQLMYRKALTLLAKDIQRMKLFPGPQLMLNHLHRIPILYDNAFPQYIGSGLTGATVGLPL